MMPEMDGIEATKLIRKNYPDLPIIALTANAVSGTKEMFLSNGFNDFLSKPIDTVKLNSILEKWLPDVKAVKSESYSKADFEIDGVDVDKAIEMLDGNLELYMELLDAFHKDSTQKIDEIKNYNNPLYTNNIHALKGTCGSIGAFALAEKAKALEAAGKRRDLTYIEQNNPEFLSTLEVLLKNVNKVLLYYH